MRAQLNLGFMYRKGRGVPQNDASAVWWYRKAAGQGNAPAQFNLGWMYNKGQGETQDFVEAVRWFRKAAEQGYASAQFNLGLMYDEGRGVPQDYVQGHMWLNLAAARYPPGQQRGLYVWLRDDVAKRMSPAQIAEAQQLAREWKAK